MPIFELDFRQMSSLHAPSYTERMKLSLLVLSFLLATGPARAQKTGDPEVDAVLEQMDARQKANERAAARAEFMHDIQGTLDSIEAAAKAEKPAEPAAALVHSALSATHAATHMTPPCPKDVPQYTSQPYNEDGDYFAEKGFDQPVVSKLDLSKIAGPKATHKMNLTVMIQRGAGWKAVDVDATLAKTARIYAQCGVRIDRVTVVEAGFPKTSTEQIDEDHAHYVAYHMPTQLSDGAPKPWVFFVKQRSDNTAKDHGGTSISYTDKAYNELNGTAWIARDSLETLDPETKKPKLNGFGDHPELVVGHELAHILTSGDHVKGPDNLLSDRPTGVNGKILPEQCSQILASQYLKPI